MSREKKRTRVSCYECGMMVAVLYLKHQILRQHGVSAPQTRGVENGGGEPATYMVSFPRVLMTVKCPVSGCLVVAHMTGRLHKHFMY